MKKSSVKRRDRKNRILRNGEMQRSDGRYSYTYRDKFGKPHTIYSWLLEPTDTVPAGCRSCVALREMEKEIYRDLQDGIVPCGGNLTIYELTRKYVDQRKNVRHNTQAGYKTVLNFLKDEKIGRKRIDKIRISDARKWLAELQENGKGYSTICSIRGVLKPAFQMACDDDLLRKNPFDFPLKDVIIKDGKERDALTEQQKRAFLEFVRLDGHYSRYYDAMVLLFGTGLRVSEFCGLTLKDLDFEKREIHVNHQLQRTRDMQYIIDETKTRNGVRIIPMTDEVYDCLQRIVKNRKNVKIEPDINGYVGFLFLDKNGMPEVALHWEKYFSQGSRKI